MPLVLSRHICVPQTTTQSWVALPAFVLLWAFTVCFRRQTFALQESFASAPPFRILVEVVKLVLSLFYHIWYTRQSHPNGYSNVNHDEEQGSERSSGAMSPRGRFVLLKDQMSMSIFFVAICYALEQRLSQSFYDQSDHHARYLITAASTLGTMLVLRFVLSRHLILLQAQGVLLQFCGLFIMRLAILGNFTHTSPILVLGLTLLDAAAVCLNDHVYKIALVPLHALNIHLFTFGIIIYVSTSAVGYIAGGASLSAFPKDHATSITSLVFLEALTGISSLAIIYHYDALVLGVLASTGAALAICWESFGTLVSDTIFIGLTLSLFGSATYFFSQNPSGRDEPKDCHSQGTRRRTFSLLALAAAGVLTLASSTYGYIWYDQSQVPPHRIPGLGHSQSESKCQRKPLPSSSNRSSHDTYHEFDDILLIVFFSHARYGANLDYYKEVYSDYFPNMVFIGPASREDAGFAHSYDVLVDSYQSDEDLSDPSFYKMAGRMAHHMLHTAMKEYDCYDGYLWAPFDTLLNIPRLQAFDKRYFWYHSPWGQYVPNPALGDAQANANKSRHAPPANLSPDPSLDLSKTWQGWQKDWWWGDPHVGLLVCMPAFNKVPSVMREHLAKFNNGTLRLIGGSSDTVYIPGRHRDKFLDILAIFLETDCFLEIATPTTIHLVVPPDEPILFLDHYWIWRPPFNAEFVRQKWREGLEVDTFHTFHWGEKDDHGVWMGNHTHVADVRLLLQESAARQGIILPS